MQPAENPLMPYGVRHYAAPIMYSQMIRPIIPINVVNAATSYGNIIASSSIPSVTCPNVAISASSKVISNGPKSKLNHSVFVGNIPSEFTEDLMLNLLRECGKVIKWNRTKDATLSKLCSFGFCEFENLRGVYRATHVLSTIDLNSLRVASKSLDQKKNADNENNATKSTLFVKCEPKVLQAAEGWGNSRITDIIQNGLGEIGLESATLQVEAEDEELRDALIKIIKSFFTSPENKNEDQMGENDLDKHTESASEMSASAEIFDDLYVNDNSNVSVESNVATPSKIDDKKTSTAWRPSEINESEKRIDRSHSIQTSRRVQERLPVSRSSSSAPNCSINQLINKGLLSREYRPHWKERDRESRFKDKEKELAKELLRREREREKYEMQSLNTKECTKLSSKDIKRLIDMDLRGERWELIFSKNSTSSYGSRTGGNGVQIVSYHGRKRDDLMKRCDKERENDEYDRFLEIKEKEALGQEEIRKRTKVVCEKSESCIKDTVSVLKSSNLKRINEIDNDDMVIGDLDLTGDKHLSGQSTVLTDSSLPHDFTQPQQDSSSAISDTNSREIEEEKNQSVADSCSTEIRRYFKPTTVMKSAKPTVKQYKNIFRDFEEYEDPLFTKKKTKPSEIGGNPVENKSTTNDKLHIQENKAQNTSGDGVSSGFPNTSIDNQKINLTNTQPSNLLKETKIAENQKLILSMVPTDKSEIFSYKIDWDLLEKKGIIDTKLRSWIKKKIVEYMGGDEELVEEVIEYMMSKIEERPDVVEFLSELEKFLDTEAEGFLKSMYKMLIFEQIRHNFNNEYKKVVV